MPLAEHRLFARGGASRRAPSRAFGPLLVALGLSSYAFACTRTPPAIDVSRATPIPSPTPAASSPSPPSPEPTAGASPPSTPALPSATLLARGAALVGPDPAGALPLFQAATGNPIADAYLAYLALDAGDASGAVEAARRAKGELEGPSVGLAQLHAAGVTIEDTLRVLRLGLEESMRSGPEEPPLSCSVFVKHGAEATAAFGALWGSTRDEHGRALKELCVGRFLAVLPKDAAARTGQALQDVFATIRTIAPQPEGTMYAGAFIADTDGLLDVLLAPESPRPAPRIALSQAIASSARREPALAVRARAFGAVRARTVPAIADAVCAFLAVRQRPADPSACRVRADTAVTSALAEWLEGRRSMQ